MSVIVKPEDQPPVGIFGARFKACFADLARDQTGKEELADLPARRYRKVGRLAFVFGNDQFGVACLGELPERLSPREAAVGKQIGPVSENVDNVNRRDQK